MIDLTWVSAADGPDAIPDPKLALQEPNGLLAAGGSLSPDWLLTSYRRGIFPWFEDGQPILWWSPDPRTILWPGEFKVSRSLAKTLRRGTFRVTADRRFAEVIAACAAPRRYTNATWITEPMQIAYTRLHELGWAHSFEAWIDAELVGGLYGVAIGGVFFGESMFAKATDASKIAFWHALNFLTQRGIELIDCQLPSAHLSRLGAINIPRADFLPLVAELTEKPIPPGEYSAAFDLMRQPSTAVLA